MPRPKKNRWINDHPGVTYFKPQGIPLRLLEQVELGVDEFEAIRLADFEGLSQEEAAPHMNVSRATFGRIVTQARYKIADAMANGKAIRIEGGEVSLRPPGPAFGRRDPYGRGGRGGNW
jgi:predicted DNA-binding protein (UPF0251 family)